MTRVDNRRNVYSNPNNARIRQVRDLIRDRRERERTGLFFFEGMRAVAQAFEHDAAIESLIVAPELLDNPFGRKLVREGRRAGIPSLEVTPEVFRDLALAEEPQGIAAVARQRWTPPAEARPSEGLCWVAL